jgi:hypothetical protein
MVYASVASFPRTSAGKLRRACFSQAIHSQLVGAAPGMFLSLDEAGNTVLNWSASSDAAVAHHLVSHTGTNLESTFVYQGAFAIGVRRTKVTFIACVHVH